MKIDLIKASAGSGKTYTLMKLLSKEIASGIRPDGLLATTFTAKAAAELQSRIRQELLGGANPELASQVFDGLIGTVNSVCGQLLSEYAVESGLSPALDVLPEENAEMIFGAAVHNVIENYAEKLEEIAARLDLNPLEESKFRKTSDWRKDVRSIVNFARSNRIDKAGLLECAEKSCVALKEVFTADNDLSLQNIADMVEPYSNFSARGKDTGKSVDNIKNFLRFPTWSEACRLGTAKYNSKADPEFPIEILTSIGDELPGSKDFYADMSTMIRQVFACAGDALDAYARYKQEFGLIDFIDQESSVLDLLENNCSFRDLMAKRINKIMVDEFQDTSPIQLALFLKLNECSQNGSVWVGDPKQAIYGFRGTDPELMAAVADAVPAYSTLEFSWRSRENLVNFVNAVFKRAFAGMPEKDVCLGIPELRRKEAVGGEIAAWQLQGNVEKRMAEMAAGIAGLIRDEKVLPGDIAVLFRTNDECYKLADALAEWNISASSPAGKLLDHTECQLIMAAYRYCIDHTDTAAAAALTAYYENDPEILNKFFRAVQEHFALPEEERKKNDPLAAVTSAAGLDKLVKPADATPAEILEFVIVQLELDRKISAMSNPDLRMSNLNELRRICSEYMKQALINRTAATPAGFVAMISTGNKDSAAGFGKNTVNVMTYHKSKGLEFSIVILGSLDPSARNGAFGIRVRQAETFDMNDPLKNRSLHYWPYPFGSLKSIAFLDDALAENPIQMHAEKCETEENKRLLYVGMTRAKDRLIFAMERKAATQAEKKADPTAADTLKIKWLDNLSDISMFDFPMESGTGKLYVDDDSFDITTEVFTEAPAAVPLPSPAVYHEPADYREQVFPAKKNPSSETADGKAVLLTQWDYFTGKIKCERSQAAALGSAFHDFIAMNPQKEGKFYAERLLKNYGVKDLVSAEVLVECCRNLYAWIASAFPGAGISCEVPMTYHDENGTLYQGFIDMLLEVPGGMIIIDHKTHPSPHDAEEYAASCAGQLELYRRAVEAASGKKVLQTVIHLPNLGKCYEVSCVNSAEKQL